MMNACSQKLTGSQLIRSMLLFFGSFLFAFCLNSYIIHEAGHALGGMLFGCHFEGFKLNPFGSGGWRDECPTRMSLTGRFVRGMGGEIFGLPFSITVTLLLWRKRNPALLPLLMSATVVCIGNVFSVVGNDYFWVLQVGSPPFILWVIGIASLVFGIILMNLLIPLAGIGISEPFWKLLLLNLSTWPFYAVIRLVYQSVAGRNMEGPISVFVFGVLLAILTAITFKPVYKLTERFFHTEPVLPSGGAVWLATGLGVGLTTILVASNPIWFA